MIVKTCAKCPVHIPVTETYCTTHRAAEEHRRSRKRQTMGLSTGHWRRVRAARLRLDGHRCQLKHPNCTGKATTVHLDPSCQGNHRLATINNTRSACAQCHGTEDAPRARAA